MKAKTKEKTYRITWTLFEDFDLNALFDLYEDFGSFEQFDCTKAKHSGPELFHGVLTPYTKLEAERLANYANLNYTRAWHQAEEVRGG